MSSQLVHGAKLYFEGRVVRWGRMERGNTNNPVVPSVLIVFAVYEFVTGCHFLISVFFISVSFCKDPENKTKIPIVNEAHQ